MTINNKIIRYDIKQMLFKVTPICVFFYITFSKYFPRGVYNIADNEPLATNDLIKLIAESQKKNYHIWNVSKSFIKLLSKLGDILKLPLNTERLNKLTETYIVSNNKIITAINKPLPLSTKEGLLKTLNSFNTNDK
jgi:hypothetical protein